VRFKRFEERAQSAHEILFVSNCCTRVNTVEENLSEKTVLGVQAIP